VRCRAARQVADSVHLRLRGKDQSSKYPSRCRPRSRTVLTVSYQSSLRLVGRRAGVLERLVDDAVVETVKLTGVARHVRVAVPPDPSGVGVVPGWLRPANCVELLGNHVVDALRLVDRP